MTLQPMKVVTPKVMASAESAAYQEGFAEATFMENAGLGIAKHLTKYPRSHPICLLCGKGNNSGDAYVAAQALMEQGFQVVAWQITNIEQSSPLCQQHHHKFLKQGGKLVQELPQKGIIVDGLFGTGFHGALREPFASVVIQANQSNLPIVAIDIPSGLNGETGEVEGAAIQARETIFLGLPKTGFFLNKGWNHVGTLHHVDFGLPPHLIECAKTPFHLITQNSVSELLPPIKRNRHKYESGHVIGVAGSPQMPGAALLAATASLRGGAGIIHLLHPDTMGQELSNSPFEVIKIPFNSSEFVVEKVNQGHAAFIGPGMGRAPATSLLLKETFAHLEIPSVIDADALTLIAQDNLSPPEGALLTPHHGEMARLLNPANPQRHRLDMTLLKACQQYAILQRITLILKGGPTFIFHPTNPPLVNPTGCPGMATAGSGDVLTGLLAALLAQGLAPYDAARVGVYLHGLAGQLAQQQMTPYCLLASDITKHLPIAFQNLSSI